MLTNRDKQLIKDHCQRILDEIELPNPSDDTIGDAAHSISALVADSWDKDPIVAMDEMIDDKSGGE